MVQLSGNTFIDIKIPNIEVNNTTFKYIKMVEHSDFRIPTFEIKLVMPTLQGFDDLYKENLPFTVTIGIDQQNSDTYDLMMTNYKIDYGNDGISVTLWAVSDLIDFMYTPRITSYDDISSNVLGSTASLDTDIDYDGDDSQVWIQHNISDKRFVYNILQNAFISEDDVPINAITIDKKLKVVSLKKALSNPPLYVFQSGVEGSDKAINYSSLSIVSDQSVWTSIFANSRQLPVISHVTHEYTLESPSNTSVTGKDYPINSNEPTFYPMQIDNGNCHDNYYKAFASNLYKKTKLYSISLQIESSRFVKPTDLPILSTVEVYPDDSGSSNDNVKGKYILSSRITHISSNGYKQIYELNRDFVL